MLDDLKNRLVKFRSLTQHSDTAPPPLKKLAAGKMLLDAPANQISK
jgi:hypothetical protein